MNKFTSGPWETGEYDDFSESYTVIKSGSRREGRGYVVTVDICDGASEADARLIAAAPDLLAALEGMVSIYAVSTGVNSMSCKIEQELTLMARAAIASARGGV